MDVFQDLCDKVLRNGKHIVPLENAGQGRTMRNAFYAWRQVQIKAGHIDLNKIKLVSGTRELVFTLPDAHGYKNQIAQSLEENTNEEQ